MNREKMVESFREAEASLGLSGFSPLTNKLYLHLKDRVIKGEITARQAKEEVIRRFKNETWSDDAV